MTCGGIVLCGGRSSRMGTPKAWLPFGDEFMLQRVVRIVSEAVNPVVVVVALGQDVPELPAGVRIVRDEQEGLGPLAGLAAGLAALGGEVEAAYLSSCDVPFLAPAFVRRVVGFLLPSPDRGRGAGGEGNAPPHGDGVTLAPQPPLPRSGEGEPNQVAVPRVGGYFHPLAAAYRLSVRDTVMSLLAADRLRPVFLFDAVPTRVIEPHEFADIDPTFQSLRNVNTPDDYAAALAELTPPPGVQSSSAERTTDH